MTHFNMRLPSHEETISNFPELPPDKTTVSKKILLLAQKAVASTRADCNWEEQLHYLSAYIPLESKVNGNLRRLVL